MNCLIDLLFFIDIDGQKLKKKQYGCCRQNFSSIADLCHVSEFIVTPLENIVSLIPNSVVVKGFRIEQFYVIFIITFWNSLEYTDCKSL